MRIPLLLAALIALALAPFAALADTDQDMVLGKAAIERGDFDAAIEALERARAAAPRRGDVCWHLARAYEREGRAGDSVAFYEHAARLDPSGVGITARADAERLRAKWVKVELDDGRENLLARRWEKAIEAFLRAFDLAAADDGSSRSTARDGTARATAGALVAAALKGREAGVKVALLPLLGAAQGSAYGDVAQQLEQALSQSLLGAGAVVLGPARKSEAAVVVQGWAGQRFNLRADDVAQGGVMLARANMRALLDPGPSPIAVPEPDPVALDLSIVAERDSRKGGAVSTARIPVAEGAMLLSGDRFRIRAQASRDAYVYAFIFDSSGRATLLYPGVERLFPDLAGAGVRTTNPTMGKRDLLVPPDPPSGKPFWFFLDESTGTETFYVAASLAPLDDVEALVKEIESAGEVGRAAAKRLGAALARRGDQSTVLDGAGGHLEMIRGRGAVVRSISVEHR